MHNFPRKIFLKLFTYKIEIKTEIKLFKTMYLKIYSLNQIWKNAENHVI